jgi:hypothetical protein
MKGFFFILLIFSIQSCTKWHDVKEGNGILYVHDVQSELHSLKDVEWKVGKNKDKMISKGFRFKFDIPKITSEDAYKLVNKHGIDSWIFKIIKQTRGRKNALGNIVYDLTNITRVSNDITVHVFYHAAAVSQNFRRFKCPAFGHRFKLEQFNTQDTNLKPSNVYANRGSNLPVPIVKPSFAPVIFSGDLSLIGSYSIEYALFNSKEKKIFSKWYKANNKIEIASEGRVMVPSCAGVREEDDLRNSRPPKSEEFRIK